MRTLMILAALTATPAFAAPVTPVKNARELHLEAFADVKSCWVDSEVECLAHDVGESCGAGGTCIPTHTVNISYASCACR